MSAPYRPVVLDESEQLLAMGYRLRYQTFCLERLFFSSDAYPTQLESDAFDAASVHVGVLNAEDELVGTARIILPTNVGFPLLRHCTLFPDQTVLTDPSNRVVEVSRVCLKRRRHGPQEARTAASPARESVFPRPTVFAPGRVSNDPFAALIKAVYQATKRLRATHWIVAVEKPLRRRIARYGLPFHLAGPEVDYFGPVAPYVLSLAELDEVIQSHEFPALDDVPAGLEPDYSAAPLSHTGL